VVILGPGGYPLSVSHQPKVSWNLNCSSRPRFSSRQPFHNRAPSSGIRLDANAIVDWVPATGRSAALAVAHSECSGERAPGSLIFAHPQDSEWRTSSLGRTGAFTLVLAKHTKHLSLVDILSVGVDRMQRNFEPMRRQVEAWRTTQVSG
jgi:hypothetical protein